MAGNPTLSSEVKEISGLTDKFVPEGRELGIPLSVVLEVLELLEPPPHPIKAIATEANDS